MKQPIVIFSMIEWYSSLLHRNHMLAKYFARKGHPVHFIEKKQLKSIKDVSSNFLLEVISVDDHITVYQIPRIPYLKGHFPPSYFLNDYFLIPYINKIAKGLKNSIVIVEFPMWINLIRNSNFKECTLCYDMSDDYELFETNPSLKQKIRSYEQNAIKEADYTFVTSKNLIQKTKPITAKTDRKSVFIIENGVDLELFKDAQLRDERVYRTFKRPIIGFIGGIFSWVNLDLIKEAAVHYKDYSFVLIGPTDQEGKIELLQQLPNVYYLGAKTKDEIAHYFKALDVGLVPYVSEAKYSRLKTVNSNKIFQYMFYGYPVVSTYYSQTESFSDMAYISHDNDAFIQNIEKAILENDREKKQKRQEFALNHSWEKVVDDMIEIIG